MRSLIIKPRTKEEFDLAFDRLTEFADGCKPLEWEGKGEIGFIFLSNEVESVNAVVDKKITKKPAH